MGKLLIDRFEVLVKAMQSFLFECTSLMAQRGRNLYSGRQQKTKAGPFTFHIEVVPPTFSDLIVKSKFLRHEEVFSRCAHIYNTFSTI